MMGGAFMVLERLILIWQGSWDDGWDTRLQKVGWDMYMYELACVMCIYTARGRCC